MRKNSEYYIEIEDKEELLLPSEIEKKKKLKRKKNEKLYSRIKWGVIITIGILIYLFYNTVLAYFFSLMKANPIVYSYYLYIENQITQKTLEGLLFISTLGSIFFLVIPSEAIFIYYLTTTNIFPIFLILTIGLGSVLGMLVNYIIGFILNERVLKLFFKEEKFYSYKEKVDKYGGYFLLFGNIFPGPVEIVALFYGAFKFNMIKYMYLTFIGRVIKYVAIFIAFYFFWDQIMQFYQHLLVYLPFLKNLF